MAELKRVKQWIAEIAEGSRTNVKVEDIKRIVDHLADNGYTVKSRPAGSHATLFHVGSEVFSVCTHRPGSSQLKRCYVDGFVNAMIELGLYED
jgi:hypothetical protein